MMDEWGWSDALHVLGVGGLTAIAFYAGYGIAKLIRIILEGGE